MKDLRDMTEPEIKRYMDGIGRWMKNRLPPGVLFCLVLFEPEQIGQYISNANRKDMVRAMREFADILERKEDVPR